MLDSLKLEVEELFGKEDLDFTLINGLKILQKFEVESVN